MLQIEWEPCVLEPARDPALERYVRRRIGALPPILPYLVACPWLARALIDSSYDARGLAYLDLGLADLVALEVSRENSCRFCYAATRAMLRFMGMSEERVRELERKLADAALDPRTSAAVAFARRVSRSQPLVNAEDCRRVEAAGFTPQQRKEIAAVVAHCLLGNRASTIPAIPPEPMERMPDRLFYRLFRPLIARALGAYRKPGKPARLDPPYAGPFALVVAAFAGLPFAPKLARMLEEMWASPVLTHRCKALIFAVIARGLGCEASGAEACRMLADEGLDDAAANRALAHLHAPELTAIENLLLPFARETLWYQPAAIQRRAQAVRTQLGAAPFLEAVGVAAMANVVCRVRAAVT